VNERPRFADATRELAIVARDLRDSRAAGDPKMVADGKLTPAQAADRLRVADAVAGEWSAYAAMQLPADAGASQAERRDMLSGALKVITARRDRAHAAMLAEGAWMGQLAIGALWQLVDAHLPQTGRIEPYLHWESYAAAVEALLWWQDRTGQASKRWSVEGTLWMREQLAAGQGRLAA
jgi:hypothetical protein